MLTGLYWWEHRYLGALVSSTIELLIDPDNGKTQFHLQKLMEEHQVHVPIAPLATERTPFERLRFTLKLTPRQRAEFLSELAKLPAVHELREVPAQSGA